MKKDKTRGLNIRSDSKDWRCAILSNLANTPFKIGELSFASAEGGIQGIKIKDKRERERVFGLSGIEALKAGRGITNSIGDEKDYFVYWDNKQIVYNSDEHRLIIGMFLYVKMWQNLKVQEALLSTKGTFIYHDVGEENPHTSLPEKFYIQVLLSLRDLLERLKDIK